MPKTSSNFSLGIVIRLSQCCSSSPSPDSAILRRDFPSKENGRVTTATVNIPISRATSATIGAPPVPVPPPIPAVTNTISAPCSASAIRSRSSIAAARPMSGFAPAPRPLVIPVPSCRTVFAAMSDKAWASVLAQIKSTPSTLFSIMCRTALPPPPPTPTTFITALCGALSTNSNMDTLPFFYKAQCHPGTPLVRHSESSQKCLPNQSRTRVTKPPASWLPLGPPEDSSSRAP